VLKAKICLQILTGSKTTAVVCRENQLNENVVSRWKKQFLENASLIFEKVRCNRMRASEWLNLNVL
jgi:transposase-like protein